VPNSRAFRVSTGFFAYANTPHSIPATISAAVESINKTQQASLRRWEDLRIGGKYIIHEICDAIDDSDFFCADVTTINANVMFELGFAIARDKRIWLIRDDSFVDSKTEFEQLRLLTTVGYRPYTNAEQIIKGFFADSPHLTPTETVFRQSIDPLLGPASENEPLLYLKSRHDTEASVRISRVIDKLTPKTILDDPHESAVQPLYWYGQKILYAPGVVAHFLMGQREGSRLTNARYAFVSGLAKGFDRPILMLTEQDQLLAPLDYRDELRYYTTPVEAARLTEEWLQQKMHNALSGPNRDSIRTGAIKLATELRDFHQQLGEYIAENEADHISDYFVETTAHMDIINGTQTIFVGRKGSGKTASLLQASRDIGQETNNLVCILKPVGYELDGLVRLFSSYEASDQNGFVIESLWKYMLYTELALTAAYHIQNVTPWLMGDPQCSKLLQLIDTEASALSGDFTVRLEGALVKLKAISADTTEEKFHRGISEALHSTLMGRLRTVLSEVLSRKHQTLLLIDNLDKAWTRKADTEHLTEFLLGLLTAVQRVRDELRYGERGRNTSRFNAAIFLRSDIFNRIIEAANEPDKISHTRLTWDDPELLLRIIEERYVASHGPESDPAQMWRNYFCSEVNGLPTREYLVSRILPRPRDIVYIVKAAVSFAVNRKHDRVEPKDILDGEMQYSQYAWDSILVENNSDIPDLEKVLGEFFGGSSVLGESATRQRVSSAGIEVEKVDDVIAQLVSLTFFGLEVSPGRFAYADERKQLQKNLVLASRYAAKAGSEPRYEINAPFRSYLELEEKLSMPQLF